MGLRHPVFTGGISGLALLGADLASAGYTALKLGTDFFAGSSFERIAATADHEQTADRD